LVSGFISKTLFALKGIQYIFPFVAITPQYRLYHQLGKVQNELIISVSGSISKIDVASNGIKYIFQFEANNQLCQPSIVKYHKSFDNSVTSSVSVFIFNNFCNLYGTQYI
jgi:hypothetical protein